MVPSPLTTPTCASADLRACAFVCLVYCVLCHHYSTFLFAFVDWSALMSCRDEASCLDLHAYLTRYVHVVHTHPDSTRRMPFQRMSFTPPSAVPSKWLPPASVDLLSTVSDVLAVELTAAVGYQRDLRSIEWNTVVARFLALQSSGRYRVAIHKKGLTAHDIA
eukprot:14820-Heterococcus_DN1.PRE.1